MKSLFIFLTGTALGIGAGIFISKKYHDDKLEKYSKELRESWYNWAKNKWPDSVDILTTNNVDEEFDDEIKRAVKVYDQRETDRVTKELSKKDYVKMVDDLKYVKGTKSFDHLEKLESDICEKIEDYQYGEDGFDVCTITYFKDGVFVDDEFNVLTDKEVIDIVGGDAYGQFMLSCASDESVFQDTTVYIRNHLHMCDYELTLDSRTYEEFKGMKH